MWDSRGLVTAAVYLLAWDFGPRIGECHVTCGALIFLTTCVLLLSNDIISRLKSLYDDGPLSKKPACGTGLAGAARERSVKDFDREGDVTAKKVRNDALNFRCIG